MEIERVFFSRGIALQATIGIPGNAANGLPAVVLCHGHSRYRNDGLDQLSDCLIAAGFLTLRMNFRGCGNCAANRYALYCGHDWCEDVMNAISYLKFIPFVDMERIGVAGISMGASAAVYATGIDKRIKSTVSMAGIGDCAEWLKWIWTQNNGDFSSFLNRLEQDSIQEAVTGQSQLINAQEMYHRPITEQNALLREAFLFSDVNAYVTLGSLRSLLSYRPVEKCPRITTPIFFAYSECDDIVPCCQSENMYSSVSSEKRELKKYPDIVHNMPTDPNRDVLLQDIAAWFRETL